MDKTTDQIDVQYWVAKLKQAMKQVPASIRVRIIWELQDGYCRSCGSEHLPCYCDNDE